MQSKTIPETALVTRDYIPTRLFGIRAATVDMAARSIEAVLATETPAEVWAADRREVVEEVLLAGGAQLPQQMPLLATHDRADLDSVLGSIRNIRREAGQIVGRLYFTAGDKRADAAWNKVAQGHLTDVSVGYHVVAAIDIPAGRQQTISGRNFSANKRTLRVATEWTPKEGSLVPIGADPGAKTRESGAVDFSSTPNLDSRKETSIMAPAIHTPSLVTREVLSNALRLRSGLPAQTEELGNRAAAIADHLSMRSLVRGALEAAGLNASKEPIDCFRDAVEYDAVQQLFAASINANLLLGWAAEADVTQQFCYVAAVPNYKKNERFIMQDSEKLEPLPRGGRANLSELDFSKKEEYKIARFAKSFIVDEQDFLDDDLSALIQVPQLLGRAAARLRGDLVFSMLLANANMSDETPIFHADRGNLADNLLSLQALQADRAAMAAQEDDAGILRGAQADIIVVAWAKALEAAEIARKISVGGNVGISVYGEARLDRGVADPLDDDPVNDVRYPAEPNSRFLFSSKQRGIEVGYLHGEQRPKLRSSALAAGEWGVQYDVRMDIGAKVIGPFWMYKNAGLSAL
ncbi:MAG: hypothetical protein IT426_20970 [Pirellulales bacterium]|nr:hypothetical protein [Pirellulales bacterium]